MRRISERFAMCPDASEVFAFTIAEFVTRHRLSRSLIYQLIKRGDLEVLHYSGQSPRITRDAERRFLKLMAQRRDATQAEPCPVGSPRNQKPAAGE